MGRKRLQAEKTGVDITDSVNISQQLETPDSKNTHNTEDFNTREPDIMEPTKVLVSRAGGLNETMGKFFKLLVLAGILATIIFSHWVYHGCTASREASNLARLKELGTSCPTIGAIPMTPLQKIVLKYLPFADKALVSSYGIGCRRQLFGNPTLLCESLFAISYLSSIAEWCMYAILAFKGIHRFIVKPIAMRAIKVLLMIVICMFVSRALLDFGRYIVPSQYFPQIAMIAETAETVAIQSLAFVWGTMAGAYRQISTIVASDNFPGESMYLTFKAGWAVLMGRPNELIVDSVHASN